MRMPAIARFSQIPPAVSRGNLEAAARLEPLVDVGGTAALVAPRVSDQAGLVGEERRALRDVLEAAEREGDVEGADGLAIPVRQQTEVQVEGLRPGDVGPR